MLKQTELHTTFISRNRHTNLFSSRILVSPTITISGAGVEGPRRNWQYTWKFIRGVMGQEGLEHCWGKVIEERAVRPSEQSLPSKKRGRGRDVEMIPTIITKNDWKSSIHRSGISRRFVCMGWRFFLLNAKRFNRDRKTASRHKISIYHDLILSRAFILRSGLFAFC